MCEPTTKPIFNKKFLLCHCSISIISVRSHILMRDLFFFLSPSQFLMFALKFEPIPFFRSRTTQYARDTTTMTTDCLRLHNENAVVFHYKKSYHFKISIDRCVQFFFYFSHRFPVSLFSIGFEIEIEFVFFLLHKTVQPYK